MSETKCVYQEAKFYNRLTIVQSWKWLTIHCTESPEEHERGKKVSRWFSNPWDNKKKQWRKVSAHFVVDDTAVIQCVPETRIAYHARGLNTRSLGIELVGKAAQSRADWLDPFGLKMLDLAATLVAVLSAKYKIQLDDETLASGILMGNGGVTTHKEVTRAYRVPGGHLDPGPNFPMGVLLGLAREKALSL